MQLAKSSLQRFQSRRSRLEEYDHFTLVGNLALPAIKRPSGGKKCPAGDQPTLEQGPYEFYGLILGGDGCENDDGVGVHVVDGDW